ncbi:MAG: hypothetical protein KAG66_09145, partial [Methylococcales bacterium]|nr:hypothetical protein [Methylococcales bacterium]
PIAISGNTIVVGKRDSTSVLVRSGTTWSKQADLTDIGSFAISDDTIAVGVPDESVVHIFTRTESTWSKQDTLIGYAPDSNPNPDSLIYVQFGYSVAISGDTIVVGEPGLGGWYHDRKVHVFTREESTWKEQVALVPTELNGFLVEFGSSVAIDGNTVVVGSRDGETFFSSAYVYDLTCDATYSLPNNQWRQISLPCNPGTNDSVTSVLGDDIPGTYGNDWRLYRYDTNGYVALTATDSLSQGVGYWVIQTSGDDRILDMPDNSTPTPDFSTDSYPASHSKACFEFETAKGCFPIPLATQANAVQWNMIGYPFISAGALGNARIQTDADSCASGCDLDTAHSQGIVHNQLWTFNGTHYEVVDTSGNLEPWGGYWLATLQSAEGLNPRLLLAKP